MASLESHEGRADMDDFDLSNDITTYNYGITLIPDAQCAPEHKEVAN